MSVLATCKGIGIPESEDFCLRNPESSALENPEYNQESGILLTIGIKNPNSTDKAGNPVPGIRN